MLVETSNFHTALVNKMRFLYVSNILVEKMNETEADDGQFKKELTYVINGKMKFV